MSTLDLLTLVAIGICAGTVNTIAGGGSLIGLPALIFMGLPAGMANATNRIGVLVQSFISAWQFNRQGLLETRATLVLVIPTCLGAFLGAHLSLDMDEERFRQVIGGMMLVMLGVLMVRPRRWLVGRRDADLPEEGAANSALVLPPFGGNRSRFSFESMNSPEDKRSPSTSAGPRATAFQRLVQFGGFFLIGVYGGFLQAGVGIFLLAGLVILGGHDLVRANAIKAVAITLFTLPPLLIFFFHDLLAWLPGLALGLGSAFGGWLGAHLTVGWGPRFVRWVLGMVIIAASSKLLDLW